jgi:hypothetical protein
MTFGIKRGFNTRYQRLIDQNILKYHISKEPIQGLKGMPESGRKYMYPERATSR